MPWPYPSKALAPNQPEKTTAIQIHIQDCLYPLGDIEKEKKVISMHLDCLYPLRDIEKEKKKLYIVTMHLDCLVIYF